MALLLVIFRVTTGSKRVNFFFLFSFFKTSKRPSTNPTDFQAFSKVCMNPAYWPAKKVHTAYATLSGLKAITAGKLAKTRSHLPQSEEVPITHTCRTQTKQFQQQTHIHGCNGLLTSVFHYFCKTQRLIQCAKQPHNVSKRFAGRKIKVNRAASRVRSTSAENEALRTQSASTYTFFFLYIYIYTQQPLYNLFITVLHFQLLQNMAHF